MNSGVGHPRIGQWYSRRDKGETFQVTGRDAEARTVQIQTFDGDVDEVDEEAWTTLPLGFSEPPEDWTGPVDDVEMDDLGYSETQMKPLEWEQPLQPLRAQEAEAWEDTTEEPDEDAEGDGHAVEELALDDPLARPRLC
ncbi:MAG TPA: DUF6763 family protein [Steroidobacteraceae bacterium]|nr:DUF6763 family protein [Steroidobacteraceae bacterium]